MSNVVTLDQNSNTGSDVIARVKALLEQSTVTQAQIAKEIGVSGSTVNQLLNGNYKADPTAMVQKLANWLTARDQRADAPRDPGFVMTETAKQIMADAKARGADIPLPTDVVVAPAFAADAPATIKPVDAVGADDMILDIGPQTASRYALMIEKAGTVVWNGPVGVFEFKAFERGTEAVAHAIAESNAFSIAGGGDTLAAVDKFGIERDVSYISTGGGAFLEFLEGKTLPAVAALEARG